MGLGGKTPQWGASERQIVGHTDIRGVAQWTQISQGHIWYGRKVFPKYKLNPTNKGPLILLRCADCSDIKKITKIYINLFY